jgi:ABC-type transport system substrate-binding protein
LADERVRLAIAHSIDRQAYIDAVHAGRGDASGGFYNKTFPEWNVPALDQGLAYDPDRARQLLSEAGYPNGITLRMPVMPSISQPMDLIFQMLGSSGITVELIQINNGELVPRGYSTENREWGLLWGRDLLTHPGNDLPKFVDLNGRSNPGRLSDNLDLSALLDDAASASDPQEARRIYAQITTELINRGVVIPLGHVSQNAAYDPAKVTGVTMGLNMQAPLPYGIRLRD